MYYKADGKSINEKVGWESEGINAEQARDIRGDILTNIRKAEGYRSLKEKRETDRAEKEQAQIEKELKEREDVKQNIKRIEEQIALAQTSEAV